MKEMQEMQAIKDFFEWCNTPVGESRGFFMSRRVIVQLPSCSCYRVLDENGDNLFSPFKFLTFEELYDYYTNIKDRRLIIVDSYGQTLKTAKYSYKRCYKVIIKLQLLGIVFKCIEDSLGLKVYQIVEGELPVDFIIN